MEMDFEQIWGFCVLTEEVIYGKMFKLWINIDKRD